MVESGQEDSAWESEPEVNRRRDLRENIARKQGAVALSDSELEIDREDYLSELPHTD